MCACRWRRPATGSAGSGASTGLPRPDPGFDDVRDRLEESDFRLRQAHRRAPRRHDVGNAAALGAAVGAARHACGEVAVARHGSAAQSGAITAFCASGLHAVARVTARPPASTRPPRSHSSCAAPAAGNGRARARSSSDIGRKRAIIAAITTSAARVAPSSHLSAMPRPCSGSAPQNTPSAPVFTSTRAPNSFMISVQKRPVPATKYGCAAQAARMRAAALARSGPRPLPRAEPRKGVRQRRQRHRPGRDRAAVDAALIRAQADAGQPLDRAAHLALHEHAPPPRSRDDRRPPRRRRRRKPACLPEQLLCSADGAPPERASAWVDA